MRAVLPVAFFASLVQARQEYVKLLPNGGGVPCPPGGSGCIAGFCPAIGHTNCAGTGDVNAFGNDFSNLGSGGWTRAYCQADSDGDGQTNGEELGDPCCQWKAGLAMSVYMMSFTPSHPSSAASFQKNYVRPLCSNLTAPGAPMGGTSGSTAVAPSVLATALLVLQLTLHG